MKKAGVRETEMGRGTWMRGNTRKWKTEVLGGVNPRYCPSLPRWDLEGGEAGTGVEIA